jgi:hypothetical protein
MKKLMKFKKKRKRAPEAVPEPANAEFTTLFLPKVICSYARSARRKRRTKRRRSKILTNS